MSAQPPTQPAPAPAGPVHTIRLPFPMQDGETILQLVRRHWFFLWPRTILWTLYALVPVIVGSIILNTIGALGKHYSWLWWIVVLVWLLYWAVRLALNYYRYHNDIWVITNQRLIDSLKTTPFNLRVDTADLVNLQDMSVVKNGIIASALNFGNVNCETAGADRVPFVISGVPNPEAIQLLIDKERDRERQRASGGPSAV
ncbi:MAG TPA: PH domain-containing protein [Dehalococcoidia bacterium]